jgi:hypothetical protein
MAIASPSSAKAVRAILSRNRSDIGCPADRFTSGPDDLADPLRHRDRAHGDRDASAHRHFSLMSAWANSN